VSFDIIHSNKLSNAFKGILALFMESLISPKLHPFLTYLDLLFAVIILQKLPNNTKMLHCLLVANTTLQFGS